MPEFARNMAFVVGINNYGGGIPLLQSAVNDAKKLVEILREQHGYQVWVCLDQLATLKNLNNFFEKTLAQQVKPDDRLLFYFAGHGIALNSEDGPQGYLIPQDAKLGDTKTYLRMTLVHECLSKLPCRHFLGILDCCFAGAFRWSSTRDLLAAPEVIHKERYDRFITDPAWQVIASAASDQKALDAFNLNIDRGEIGNYSPFAAALFEALTGKADAYPPATNGKPPGDGVITATELYLYLRDRVELATQRNRLRQTPGIWVLNKHDKGEYIFLTPGHILNLPPAPPLDESQNPYRGLQSFEEEHSNLFFGRQSLTEKLHEFVCKHPLTVVLGASGSGKSSVVKAGLIPKLKKNQQQWCILPTMRPGESPLKALTNTLATVNLASASITSLPTHQKVESLSGSLAACCRANPNSKLLLVIDQLEELITLCKEEQEREKFLSLLAQALTQYPKQLRIVLTLRSDFEPQFQDTTLKEYWNAARFVVPQMTRVQLREAIEEPASAKVMYFQSEDPKHPLTEQLIDEVADMPGALPLLSFTLSELYLKYLKRQKIAQDRGETIDRAIAEADYKELGGVARSLTQKADSKYEELVEQDKAYEQTIRQVMLRMVAVGGDFARRRVPLSELEYPPTQNERVKEVIRRFSAARLLVEGQDTEGNPYVEPAHDALVRGWQKLLTWKQEYDESLILQRRLTPAAQEWKTVTTKEQPSGFQAKAEPVIDLLDKKLYVAENLFNNINAQLLRLWRRRQNQQERSREKPVQFLWNANPYLDVLNENLNSNDNWFNQVEAEFVQESVLQKRRNISWRWRIAIAFILGLSGLTIATLIGQRNAQIQEIGALREASEANLVSNNQLDALLLSLQGGKGLRNNQLLKLFPPDSQQRDEVITTLRKVFYTVQESNRLKLPSGEIVGMSPSSDGKHLIASDDGQGTISLRNWENLQEKVAEFPGHEGNNISASFSPNGKQMATYNRYGEKIFIRLWDIASQTPIQYPRIINSSFIKDFSFNSNGNRVAILTSDNAFLWDLVNNQVYTFTEFQQQETPVGIGFTNDGKLLVATKAGNIFDWYSSNQSALIKINFLVNLDDSDYTTGNAQVIFSPNGKQFLKTDLIHRCFPVEKYELSDAIITPSELNAGCLVEYSPDGTKIAIGNEDGTIYLYDLKKESLNDSFIELKAHQGEVTELSFSSDGKQLFSLGTDNIIKSFKIEPKNLDNSQSSELKSTLQNAQTNQDSLKFIGFSSDGNQIISLQSDGSIFLSNLSGKNELLLKTEPDSKNNIVNAVVSSDMSKIAIARKDNTIEQRNISSNKPGKSFQIPEGKKFHRMIFHPKNGNLIVINQEQHSYNDGSEYSEYITTDVWSDNPSKKPIREQILGKSIGLSFGSDGDLIVHTLQNMGGGGIRLESFNLDKQQQVTFFDLAWLDADTVGFSQDTHLMATATKEGVVKLWDFWGKRLLAEFEAHQTKIEGINFSSDSSSMITIGEDGIAKSWRIGDLDDLLAKGCDRARDYLKNNPNVSESERHLCDN